MPQWGLTEHLRNTKPWGIPGDWLAASKVVTDPVHGDIFLNRLEIAVINSSSFQRLRRIRQLGMVHLVYPGATHTRFAHSLGALRLAQDLLDIVLGQSESPQAVDDLFRSWRLNLDGEYDKTVAEAIVLARVGALLHDICHVPFSHTVEDDLALLEPHDANGARFEEYVGALGDARSDEFGVVQELLRNDGLIDALRPLVLSKELDSDNQRVDPEERLRSFSQAAQRPASFAFVADMVGNTICADLLDYLRRDHLYTGLPAALGTRFMTGFYVAPDRDDDCGKAHYPERMSLRIAHNGRERKDIVSELLKHLRFRYELQERVYSHHAKTAADAMLGLALGAYFDAAYLKRLKRLQAPSVRLAIKEGETVDRVEAALEKDLGRTKAAARRERVLLSAREDLEQTVRWAGDDALLERLAASRPAKAQSSIDRCHAAAGQLAEDLLARRLFKRAAESHRASAHERLHELFSSHAARQRLTAQAARFAEIEPTQVALWVPDPRMRMKTAEVLVDYGTGIAPFNEHSFLANDIYGAHRALWAITVYIQPSLHNSDAEGWVLAELARCMGVEWDRRKPPAAVTPDDWPLARAIEIVDAELSVDGLRDRVLHTHEEGTGLTCSLLLATAKAMAREVSS